MVDTRSNTARQLRTRAVTLSDRPPVLKRRKPSVVVEIQNRRPRTLSRASGARAAVSPPLIESTHVKSTSNATAKRQSTTLSSPRKRTSTSGGGRRVTDSVAVNTSKRPSRSSGTDVNRPSDLGSDRQTRTPQEPYKGLKRKLGDLDEPACDLTTASGSKKQESLIEDLRAQLEIATRRFQTKNDELEALRTVEKDAETKFKLWEQRLFEREHEMLSKERKVQQREDELDEREIAVVTKEDTTHPEIARAEQIVKTLEDKFTCALCYDIMAHPFTLMSPRCGHSFCASCLIEWALSQLHVDCGHWHEPLECPLCRAVLPEAPYEVPREELSCPFAPNRLASDVLSGLLDELFVFLANTEVDGEADVPHSRKGKEKGVKRRRITYDDEDPSVGAWREGGDARASWKRRDTIGRQYMSSFMSKWSNFTPHDLVKFKKKYAQECAKV